MKKIFAILLTLLFSCPALADETFGSWDKWKSHLSQTWESPDYDLIIPANTWHNRLTYDHDKIDEYNERPWGIGFGKRYYDEDKDLHSLVAMFFMDSHDDPEPLIGYQFQKRWYAGADDKWAVGLGYSMGFTARSDFDWIPFPYIAPILAFQYRRVSIENTYIPGGRNNGNVLFTWVRIEI